MGFGPCCAAVPHVAAPPSFALGSSGAHKAQGLDQWKEFGPLGGRMLAPREYYLANGHLPEIWDRAAALRMVAPDPLSRDPVHACRTNSAKPMVDMDPPSFFRPDRACCFALWRTLEAQFAGFLGSRAKWSAVRRWGRVWQISFSREGVGFQCTFH